MKQPWEWTEDDLIALIDNEVEESLSLEYKNSFALRKDSTAVEEISKDVSAFANSAGGSIIYGIEEDNQKPKRLDGIDPLTVKREWLEQIITSKIHPRIDGIRIVPISLTQTSPDKVAYHVYIPSSNRAPHMAANNKYHKRQNFISIPMQDYEVRDVMRRGSAPDLNISATSTPQLLQPRAVANKLTYQTSLRIEVNNRAPEPANSFILSLLFPRTHEPQLPGWTENDKFSTECDGTKIELVRHTEAFGARTLKAPIFGSQAMIVGHIYVEFPCQPEDSYFFWQIEAPHAEKNTGVIRMSVAGGYLKCYPDDLNLFTEFVKI